MSQPTDGVRAEPDRPEYRGLLVYRNLRHRYSFLYPQDWLLVDVPEAAGGGVVCYPDASDEATFLRVQSRRFRLRVRTDDLSEVEAGFREGLRSLPHLDVLQEEANAVGDLIDLQARHRFADGDATRERWVRVLYQGKVQITLSAQGSSAAAFAYWLPMVNTVMRTVQFADWWAELTGESWKRELPRAVPGGESEPGAPPGGGVPPGGS